MAIDRGWWRAARRLGRIAPHVFGRGQGEAISFYSEVTALGEEGRITEAVALATVRLQEPDLPAHSRNASIEILISAGEYTAARAGEPEPYEPANTHEAAGLALIQINLAEADYNLGQWDAAAARLAGLDKACALRPITYAGLRVQRAWIAAHQNRAADALDLCASVRQEWFPANYRAEYHFARAAALLAAGRLDEAAAAVDAGERIARRLSSKRNALFLRARVTAARGLWAEAEELCRTAAEHRFRGQGGDGLLLWSQTLKELGRHNEANDALRLILGRDPESESAGVAAALLRDGG